MTHVKLNRSRDHAQVNELDTKSPGVVIRSG
jgi:hypothetical protein